MPLIRDLVADARRMVYGSMQEQINLVAAPYTAGATSLTLELDVSSISQGMTLASGLNVWFVKGVDAGSNTVYVIPGLANSPTANAAVGDFVYIKPRVTDWHLFSALNDEIARLSSPSLGLYKIGSWTVSVDSVWQTYDVPAGVTFSSIARVRYLQPATPDVWVDLPNSAWRFDASNNLVQLLRWIPTSADVQFVYKAPFTKATALDDDAVADCGLSESMTDIPVLGVASNLLLTTEARRNQVQTQGDPRRASEVQITGNSSAARQFERMYQERVQEEYARLVASLPIFRGIA